MYYIKKDIIKINDVQLNEHLSYNVNFDLITKHIICILFLFVDWFIFKNLSNNGNVNLWISVIHII